MLPPIKKIPVFFIIIASCVVSCATSHKRPCTEGGQPAREGNIGFQGIKRCYQKEDKSGKVVNDGKYFEWYNSDKIALTGQYKLGKKVGRWIEYNEKGEKISDKYFDENGKEANPP
jgi:antitoxin component YwqK of YwqJK toxin-antitoxin module